MELSTAYVAAFGAGNVLVLLVLHRVLQRLISPKTSVGSDLMGENSARALREVGDVLAVFFIGAAVTKNCVVGESIGHDVVWSAAYGALGLALLELVGWLGIRLLLAKRLAGALERGNVAAGVAVAGHYVATGLLTSRAVAGSDLRGLGLSLAFFAIGIVTHQVIVTGFRAVTTYDDAEQIEGENLAAALSYGGISIAVAVVVARALEGGDFPGWTEAFAGFGALSLTTLALYPLRQLVVQGLVLGARPSIRGGALDLAIGRDRNVGAAALEATCYVGAALALAVLA